MLARKLFSSLTTEHLSIRIQISIIKSAYISDGFQNLYGASSNIFYWAKCLVFTLLTILIGKIISVLIHTQQKVLVLN